MADIPTQPYGPYRSTQDQIKRVACTRCRAQKLKCLKSKDDGNSGKCDRCSRANAECHYVASRPVGRPRTCQSERTSCTPSSSTSPLQTAAAADQHNLQFDQDYMNTPWDATTLSVDTHTFDTFFGDIDSSLEQSDASTSGKFVLFTPATEQCSSSFSNESGSGSYTSTATTRGFPPNTQRETASDAHTSMQDAGKSMQRLAEMGLDLHSQIAKYQNAGNGVLLAELVCIVLRKSSDYLDVLLSLNASHKSANPNAASSSRTDEQADQPPQLDMPAAFQLLIPYVRLAQLHHILYEAMLLCMTNEESGLVVQTAFPDIWVGDVCVNTGGFFRACLLLRFNMDLLAEIETVLDLPHEARLCSPDIESGTGGNTGLAPNRGKGSSGMLRKTVSPRLLKMILDERNWDVHSTRECIARIKDLFRSS